MKLDDFQRAFQASIFSRDPEGLPEDCGLEPRHRVEVYVDGYPARIAEALGETFERLQMLLGEETWWELVELFSLEFKSPSRNLSDAARFLPEFLESCTLIETYPYLADLARFELKLMDCFHAAAVTALTVPALQAQMAAGPERLKLFLQDHVLPTTFGWPVFDVWRELKPGVDPEAPPVKGPQTVLIYRKGWEVMIEAIAPTQELFLRTLGIEGSFGDACRALEESLSADSDPPPLYDWLIQWMNKELFKTS